MIRPDVIHYFCSREHLYTLASYLSAWAAPDLRSRMVGIPYEVLPSPLPAAQPGVYVFADLERLSPAGMLLATQIHDAIAALGDRARILNAPARVLRRYALLRALHDAGINTFDAYRVGEQRRPRTWPVLLRRESDHAGPIGELLRTPEELDAAVAALARSEGGADEAIVVEYVDTADAQGVYRKYGAFLIGDRVIPRHLLLSRRWCVKDTDLLEPEHIAEELRYLESFPHEAQVRQVFRLANIDYGRIDYSLHGDRIQVWEINTNPTLIYAALAKPGAPRRRANDRFAHLSREAFLALDAPFAR